MIKTEEDLFQQIDNLSKQEPEEEEEEKFDDSFFNDKSLKKMGSGDFEDLFDLSNILTTTKEENTAGNITDKIEINTLLSQFSKSDVKVVKELVKELK